MMILVMMTMMMKEEQINKNGAPNKALIFTQMKGEMHSSQSNIEHVDLRILTQINIIDINII